MDSNNFIKNSSGPGGAECAPRRSTRNTGAETVYLSLCRSGHFENFFIRAGKIFSLCGKGGTEKGA
jgi:hypothetical protein